MKSHKFSVLSFALLAAAGASAAVDNASGSGATAASPAVAGATGGVPDSNVAGTEKAKRAPKNPDNILDIINGRLPLPLVFAIRFKETGTTADRAKKYGTSVGKVFDIVKGRNFGYIDATYKPAADEVAAANAWCETAKTAKGKTLKEAGGDPDAIKALVATMGVATAEEVGARNWTTRVVGEAKAPVAPVAGAEGTTTAAAPAAAAKGDAKPAAKLF